ncbi:MAG: hypothetical protein DRO09_04205 [Thermoprotei archaeon]|nr:MAG: hypothetical protein DRO09_04205 [Thermoprotei archaeon]
MAKSKGMVLPWWVKSKTVWGVVLLLLGTLYGKLTGDYTNGATIVGMALSILGLRHAIEKKK